MDVKKIISTPIKLYFVEPEYIRILAPAIGYILFGIGNIYFLSLPWKKYQRLLHLPLAAISIVGLKLMDVFVCAVPFPAMVVIIWAFVKEENAEPIMITDEKRNRKNEGGRGVFIFINGSVGVLLTF